MKPHPETENSLFLKNLQLLAERKRVSQDSHHLEIKSPPGRRGLPRRLLLALGLAVPLAVVGYPHVSTLINQIQSSNNLPFEPNLNQKPLPSCDAPVMSFSPNGEPPSIKGTFGQLGIECRRSLTPIPRSDIDDALDYEFDYFSAVQKIILSAGKP